MNAKVRVNDTIQAAKAEGVLPAEAEALAQDTRPWPVVLLTALGAWLAAIPLTIVVGIAVMPRNHETAGLFVVGLLVLAGAIAVLRSKSIPLFVEQLAVPGLIVGGSCIAFTIFDGMHWKGGAGLVGLMCLVVAVLIPRAWLRVLLSGGAAVLLAIATVDDTWSRGDGVANDFWWAWHVVGLLAGLAAVAQSRLGAEGSSARVAIALDAMVAGVVIAMLAALSWWSGMAFLVGATLQAHGGDGASSHVHAADFMVLQTISAALAVAGAAWLARQWPTARKPWTAGVAVVLVLLAWFMPSLGAVLLALAVCATARRWMLASTAGVAFAWILSSFYYALTWPLATKAWVLVACGALLAALAWLASGRGLPASTPGMQSLQAMPRHVSGGIALTLVATLAVANVGIWQKEQIARSARTIYVELAPRDPRSLMQGDYMSLNFRLPLPVQDAVRDLDDGAKPRVIAKVDAQGVATIVRIDDGSPHAADELPIALVYKDGRWIFVTDAWFFKEGEAERYAPARFGEFKVGADGKAMLVGMRGKDLQPL
jgi:uncharacterized membrane-anchored protein